MENKLYKEWKTLKEDSHTENALMTISDIVKFYQRGRIVINPAYQRSYRWDNIQKTRFIESVLLKYPIPPIIAIKYENENGLYTYEIIDGVQRLSTIFEFLKVPDKNGAFVINSNHKLDKLTGANTLSQLNGKDWDYFKKVEFDFVFESSPILFTNLFTNNELIKFESFERLNTLSSPLSTQEVRNSILALKLKDGFKDLSSKIRKISENNFPKPNLSKGIDMEYFLEFSLIKRYYLYEDDIKKMIKVMNKKSSSKHFDNLLTSYTKLLDADKFYEDYKDYEDFLNLHIKYFFKKYDIKSGVTSGGIIKFFFEISAFIYTQNIVINIEDLYKTYFSRNYNDIMKTELDRNNPNAKVRFDTARISVERLKNEGRLY